jgi:hypothetical protein
MRKKENIFQAQLVNTTSVNLNQSQGINSLYLQERVGGKWSLKETLREFKGGT